MADLSARAELCLATAITDFVSTANEGDGTLTEIALAKAGTTKFNRAIYYERLLEEDIHHLSRLKSNMSFGSGFGKEAMQPLVLGSEINRKGADRFVVEKNLLSFDLDFKDNFENYGAEHRETLRVQFSETLANALSGAGIQPWMTAFSGNGLHLHFKMKMPYRIESAQRYTEIYDSVRNYLECVAGLKFDPACSNPSRLMRLPFSTNWKNERDPVPCQLLQHNPASDFSEVFAGFLTMASVETKVERKFTKDKQVILAKLSLERILEHFRYEKMGTMRVKNGQTVCSSPFKSDSTPSFYFDTHKNLFFDFSSGFGGDVFTLIGKLSGFDTKTEFTKVLGLAAKIAGVQVSEVRSTGFHVDEKGVWYQGANDGEALWIATPILVDALTRDSFSKSWGRLLSFKDQDAVTKQWSMPMELLAGDGSEIRRVLLNFGVEMAIGKRERQLFLSFLQSTKPKKRADCVNRIGWHSDMYVLPNEVIRQKEDDSTVILQTFSIDTSFSTKGTLEDWQRNVGSLCIGNSRLVFAISTAFASTLLKITGDENGGFHFVGPSSIGKSITLKVAASVWGNPGLNGFAKRWRSTLNGLEAVAASRCDSLLVLDELGEVTPKDAGIAAYMLSGGVGKNRATKDATRASSLEWRLLFLSSGEISLGQHIAQSGEHVNAGQEIRMLDIPAERPGSSGIFENIHGFQSANSFALALGESAEKVYGAPIRYFLEKIVANPSSCDAVNRKRREFISSLNVSGNHGQIQRALHRFALIAAAGDLGVDFGILPWAKGEAFDAAQTCFEDWFHLWGLGGSREGQQLVQQIRTLLQEFGPSRFPILQDVKKSPEDHRQQLWGFRKENPDKSYEWIVLSEVFRTQLCRGHDFRRALRDLKERDLVSGVSVLMRLPFLGTTRVMILKSTIILAL